MNTSLFFDISTWMLGATLGVARMGPIFFMLPFFNSSVLGGTTRTAVMLIVGLGFWPVPLESMANIEASVYIAAIAQELFIGLVLGVILAWPFWIFHAVGGFIDNQRGATLSSTIDPANGIDTSELSNFFNIFCAAIYLQSGGMLKFVEAVSDSYRLCDPLQGCSISIKPALSLLNGLQASTIILASPVIAGLLLSEFTLGLLSRFTPQLNAFAISLTVKSVVALSILLIYFSPFFPDQVSHLGLLNRQIPSWFEAR